MEFHLFKLIWFDFTILIADAIRLISEGIPASASVFRGSIRGFLYAVIDNSGYVIFVGHDILLELFQEGRAFGANFNRRSSRTYLALQWKLGVF